MSQESIPDPGPYIDHFPKNAQKSEPIERDDWNDSCGCERISTEPAAVAICIQGRRPLMDFPKPKLGFLNSKISLQNSDFYPKRETTSSKYFSHQVGEIIR